MRSFILLLSLASERDVPANDGWVTDLADLVTPTEEQDLEALMESYKLGSGNDIALLTVPDLGGEPIEYFSLRVARQWKLGSVEKNNGALLVVSKGDRAMRIEVGRGLEGTLPDVICGRIIRDVMTPQFQQGNFSAGLRLGIEALQKAAGGDYAALPEPSASPRGVGRFIPFASFFLIMILMTRKRRRGGRSGMSRGSIWPWIIAANAFDRSSHRHSQSDVGRGSFGGFGGGGGFSGGGASGRW